MIKSYEVFDSSTLRRAKDQKFSPRCMNTFNTKAEAEKYATDHAANSGRHMDLIVCEVTYTPIMEVTCTVSVTTSKKDL